MLNVANQTFCETELSGVRYPNAPTNVMHLPMLCSTTPHPGYVGEKVGHLTCFDTKTFPICGEFNSSPYACITIKSTDGQIPHLFLNI